VAGHSLNCAASRASRRESALPKSGCAVDTARTPAPGANGGCRAPPRSAKQAPRTRNAMNGRTDLGSAKKLRFANFDSSRRAQAREVPARVHVLVHVTLPPQRSRACVSCLCLHGLQLHGLSLCRFLRLVRLRKLSGHRVATAVPVVAWILMESVHFLVLKTPISCGIPCVYVQAAWCGATATVWASAGARACAAPPLSLSCDTPSRIAPTPEPPRIPQPLTRAAMAAPRCSGVTDRGR